MKIWKIIDGFPSYRISNDGEIVGPQGKVLKGFSNNSGYLYVTLFNKGSGKRESIHRLVATAFHENPRNKKCVNHKDSNKTNNAASNLEWCTHSENITHAIRVTKTHKAPTWAGKFGAEHNKSIAFDVVFADGKKVSFGSGYEAKRYGLENTAISWARCHKDLPYTFKRGVMKGITVLN